MPPPPLSSSTIVSFSPRRRAASRPPMSCASATSPISSTTGPLARGGRAEGRGDGAVDAVGAAVAQHARRVRAHRPERLDVAHRHRGGDEQRRLRGSSTPSSARDRGLGELLAAEHARRSPRRRARRRCASPPASPGPRRAPAGASPVSAARSAARGLQRERVASAPTPGPARRPRGRAPPACTPSRPASHARRGLDTGRSPTRRTRSGLQRRGERLVAQQRVVVGDRGRAAARARQRIGQQRPAGGRGERRRGLAQRASSRSSRPATSTPRAGPATSSRSVARRGDRGARPALRAGGRRTYGAPSGRPVSSCGQRLVAHQRLAQREVQVHRARAALQRRPVGAARERAHPAQPLGARPRARRPRRTTCAAPPNSFSWSIACPAPFSRSSGGRSAVSSSSGTRASRASIAAGSSSAAAVPEVHVTATGSPEAFAEPEREEARAALVDVRVAAQPRLARERQHERRAARARARCTPRACRSARARRRTRAAARSGRSWGCRLAAS